MSERFKTKPLFVVSNNLPVEIVNLILAITSVIGYITSNENN